MVFSTVAIVDRFVVGVVGDGGSAMSVGSKGVVGEGVSDGNGEEVVKEAVKEVFVIAMCEGFRLCVNRELKMSSGVLQSIGKCH